MLSTLKKPLLWSLAGTMTLLSVAQPAAAILGVWRRTAVRVAVVDTVAVSAATSAAATSAAAASAAQKAATAATPAPAATPPK